MTKQRDDFDDYDDGLTAEERAILAETDEVDEDSRTIGEMMDAGLNNEAGDESGEEEGGEEGDEGEPESDGLAESDGTQTDSAPIATPAPLEPIAPKSDEPTPFRPQPVQPVQYDVPAVPEDAEQQLADILAQKKALTTQLENYEVDAATYQSQLDVLNDKALDLRLAIRDADNARALNAQNEQAAWAQTCDAFLTANKATYADNPDMTALLNQAVIQVANDPENAGLNGWQMLEKAHATTLQEAQAQFNRMARLFNPDAVKAQADPAVKQKAPAKRPVMPPTIGGLPSAGNIDTGDEFSALDKLDGTALEEAIGRMSERQLELYYRSL
ncbi:hypothetical protein [Chitinimonas sp. BJB300]|uniref:hypothetical protein n=1 Tax=Chitinimonas sp. BJB300 TaxID=1559339 RepID=UPI000C1173E9|nr:hypothetical protein [Chitinimonas sp. BJB300]PHV09853.1 hypothetical protein CSQ89_19360 [Chitinimonas sp. BJB300]TSJ85961.1 hypothetical protein FG002_017245 [Chitinimonas sp. BJB300]